MTRSWRLAIAGLGAAARTIHLPAYRRLPRLEVVGGHDPAGLGSSFAFPCFDSVQTMLERTQPDLLVVASPPATHYDLVRSGLEAGCHVLCEKPFMPTLEQARSIVAMAARLDRRVVVNQQYRFMNIHHQARNLCGRRELGDLLFVSARQTFRTDSKTEAGWRGGDPQRTCKEFGIHVLDLCRFFFDADPVRVTARMPRPHDPAGPDLLDLIQLEFPGGRAAEISLDRLTRGRHSYLEMRLDGTHGCIETRLGGGIELRFGLRGGRRRPFFELDVSLGGRARLYHGERYRNVARDPLNLFSRATGRLMEAYLDALEAEAAPPCEGADNLRSLALMFAAYASDRLGTTLEMDYDAEAGWRQREATDR